MAIDKSKSLLMAQRLKELRNETGLSHESLKKALFEKYEIDISVDSLKNYEVSKSSHTKAYKNDGMRVEYLRCLADFYGVSADYILGANVPRSPDFSIREIANKTGLTEDNVTALIAWVNLPNFAQVQDIEQLSTIELSVKKKAVKIGSPDYARTLCIDLIRKLISAVTNRADDICKAYNSFLLCFEDSQKYKWGRRPKSIDKDIFMELTKEGYRIVPAHHAMRLDWENLESILNYEVRKGLLDDLERRIPSNGND